MRKPCFKSTQSDRRIVIDNGRDLSSEAITMACLQFGIELVRTSARNPWQKAKIERIHARINANPDITAGRLLEESGDV